LLDLQEAIHDALRLLHRTYLEDSQAHRTTNEWGKSNLSDEVNEGVRLAQRKVAILVERVADDGVRTDVKAPMSTAADTLLARSEGEASLSLKRSSGDATQALEKIGIAVRKHY
jgi:hypothetical protein